MSYDIRRCPENEIILLLSHMINGNDPFSMRWDGEDIHFHFRKNKQDLRIWIRASGFTNFQFYTFIDNVRIDGDVPIEAVKNLQKMAHCCKFPSIKKYIKGL